MSEPVRDAHRHGPACRMGAMGVPHVLRMLCDAPARPVHDPTIMGGDRDPDGNTITVVRSYSMTMHADRAGVVPDVPFRPTPPDIRGGTIMFHEIPGFDVECHRGVT